MAAADNVLKTSDAGPHKSFLDIGLNISWWRAIKREIPTLSTEHNFVSGKTVLGDEQLERATDGAFTSLKSIVCRAVDKVYPELDGANDRLCVAAVGSLVRIAEICAETERRDEHALFVAEVPISGDRPEAITITGSPLRC